MDLEFFVCRHCGDVIAYVKDSGVKMLCCGDPVQKPAGLWNREA